jgi:hypothetical protein
VEAGFGDLIENLVATTDILITGLRESRKSRWSALEWVKQRLGIVSLAWSAAVRVGRDIINQASIACVVLFLHLPF